MASDIRQTIPRKVLLAVVLANGAVDAPRLLSAGPVSAMGMLTIIIACATWLVWAERPPLSQLFGPMLPVVLFCAYLVGSIPFNPPTVPGFQTLMVMLAFVGCMLLAARETAANPNLAVELGRAMERAFVIALVLYFLTMLGARVRGEDLVGFRAAALYFLIPMAHFLGRWRAGNKWALFVCLLILGLMFQSMSRMALVAGTLMVPVAVMLRGDRKALLQTVVVGSVFGGALTAGIMYYPPMYDRFFKEDASLEVGGVAINATGRTIVWDQIWRSFEKHPVFGQGAGSTWPYTVIDGMDHPHNDYLRIAHDQGTVGVTLWVVGLAIIGAQLFRNARRARQTQRMTELVHVSAFVALVGIGCTMVSDNPISYIYIMGPLGVMLGTSLGLGRATDLVLSPPGPQGATALHPYPRAEPVPSPRRQAIGNPAR